MCRFSIIIPVYNAAKFLRPCLESVLEAVEKVERVERVERVEVICVDDGSTDGSAEILAYFARTSHTSHTSHTSLTIISQTNAGVSAARNRGLEAATGEWVCFVDADDTVEPDWLKKYEDKFEETAADVVRLKDDGDWAFDDGYPWKYAIRREVALKARFPEGVAMSEDGLYVARVLPFVKKIAVLDEMTYNHIVRPGTAMLRPLASAERLLFLKAVRDLAAANSPVGKDVLSRFAADAVITWLGRPRDVKCKREIRQVWTDLHRMGCARCRAVRPLLRAPYFLYAATGLLWPTRLLLSTIRILVKLRNAL